MFGWPSGPSSGSYRYEILLPSPSHPEGGASDQNETPSSMDEAARGHAPAPLQREREISMRKDIHEQITDESKYGEHWHLHEGLD